MQDDDLDVDLTPKQVVDRLDKYIVGQVEIPQTSICLLAGLTCFTDLSCHHFHAAHSSASLYFQLTEDARHSHNLQTVTEDLVANTLTMMKSRVYLA